MDRRREPKVVTRVNCKAKIRFHVDYTTKKWKVRVFKEVHNHELIPEKHVHLVPAFRKMNEADKAQVNSLHLQGVRTCHIMGLLLGQKDGYDNLGFIKKDLYNHIDKEKRARIQDGDAFEVLAYLQAKADKDPMLFSKFTVSDDGRLQHLFWADGCSLFDYECFGDVLAFDTTYKKNKYNKPLVIFCGYNHHGQTTIFASALVDDEKIETYTWVLRTLREAMSSKYPNTIVTDGGAAMREAIKVRFPESFHRPCLWHLQQNALENVKNSNFIEKLKRMMYSNYTPEKFEEKWKQVVDEYNLGDNAWVNKAFRMRSMWASAFMHDKLLTGVRTTSICEGVNSFIKKYIHHKNSLLEFMRNFEAAVTEYRQNEFLSDFKSTYGDPVMATSLLKLEFAASKIFTRNKFWEVRRELEHVAAIIVMERGVSGDIVTFKMSIFGSCDNEYTVVLDRKQKHIVCNCRRFESKGIPCSHIFCAMKYEHMEDFPDSLVCKRWMKNAKIDRMSSSEVKSSDHEKMCMLRTGALSALCNRLCIIVGKNSDDFLEIKDEIYKLISRVEEHRGINTNMCNSSVEVRDPTMVRTIGDPKVVKTKGAPRKKNKFKKSTRCSECKKVGHNSRTCPKHVAPDDSLNLQSQEEPHGQVIEYLSPIDTTGTQSLHVNSDSNVVNDITEDAVEMDGTDDIDRIQGSTQDVTFDHGDMNRDCPGATTPTLSNSQPMGMVDLLMSYGDPVGGDFALNHGCGR